MHKMELMPEETVVMVIDFQEKLMAVMSNREEVYKQANLILATAQQFKMPVIVTEQYPRGLGHTEEEVKTYIPENADYAEKNSFSAYTPEVKALLEKIGRKTVLVMGSETHVCVYQTTRELVAQGFNVHVIKDAACSRTEANHQSGLDLMQQAGAVINNAESVVFDLLKTGGTPEFKVISPMLK